MIIRQQWRTEGGHYVMPPHLVAEGAPPPPLSALSPEGSHFGGLSCQGQGAVTGPGCQGAGRPAL